MRIERFRAAAIAVVGFCAAIAGLEIAASAEDTPRGFPARAVKIVVPYPAGGIPDQLARFVAERLQVAFAQPFVVENRPGASTLLGARAVAGAAPDGYTLLLPTVTTLSIAPQLAPKTGFDPLRDLAPITRLGATNFFLVVRSAFPAENLRAWIEEVRRQPGRYVYASAGIGTPHHLFMELLKKELGLDIVHAPYKGSNEAVPDLLGGRVDMAFLDGSLAYSHIQSGQLRALGTSMAKGTELIPGVPSIASGVPGFDWSGWVALAGPRDIPQAIAARIAEQVALIQATPQYREILKSAIMEPLPPLSPEQTAAFVRAEFDRWGAVLKASGALPERAVRCLVQPMVMS